MPTPELPPTADPIVPPDMPEIEDLDDDFPPLDGEDEDDDYDPDEEGDDLPDDFALTLED